jgi:DNA polymerase-3 subunit epsilon
LATFEVLDAQVEKYADLPNDIAALSEFSSHNKFADLAGFIAFDDKDEEIFALENIKVKK